MTLANVGNDQWPKQVIFVCYSDGLNDCEFDHLVLFVKLIMIQEKLWNSLLIRDYDDKLQFFSVC